MSIRSHVLLSSVIIAALSIYVSASGETGENSTHSASATTTGEPLFAPIDDASDDIVSWADGRPVTNWTDEIAKRDLAINSYLNDSDPEHAKAYGFRMGQTPKLAWDWFQNNPVGFNGVPFVLLKTILDLNPDHENSTLRGLARMWKRESVLPFGTQTAPWTLDHIGVRPSPGDYSSEGVARPINERQSPLPYGFAFENPRSFKPLSQTEATIIDARLFAKRVFQNTSLLIAKLRTADKEENWEHDRPGFGSPGALDRVSFSCAACHVGRVVVSGKMKSLPGMPDTEIEPQYYSKLLMHTAAAFIQSGFEPAKMTAVNPADIKPNTAAVRALYAEMLNKASFHPETLYGPSPTQIARAKIQALAIADNFPSVMQDLIALGVKTHFIYHVVGKNNAYKGPQSEIFEGRPGQMDAFGIASGLVAIHTRRSDNSFLEFIKRDNPNNPFFTGFSKANGQPTDTAGMTDRVTDAKTAAARIFKNIAAWAPPAAAPVDIKSLNWASERYHANWDGNQGASSRALASGASATGDPRLVNVRIHEPLNPFIDNLPPPPYPFADVDLARAREGKAIFKLSCATCHARRSATIYPASALGVDPNRSMVNTSVSRYGLAALVMEACTIYGLNNKDKPGADWCMPKGDWEARLDENFRDTPRRVVERTNGYKADMLRGIWAQAPYLHNGSVPTLGQLICPTTRPKSFVRGNVNYDEALIGFEWVNNPKERYGPNDSVHVVLYDTAEPGRANTGHIFGADLCPDTTGLDPIADRKEIETRILASRVGALLAYLKTL